MGGEERREERREEERGGELRSTCSRITRSLLKWPEVSPDTSSSRSSSYSEEKSANALSVTLEHKINMFIISGEFIMDCCMYECECEYECAYYPVYKQRQCPSPAEVFLRQGSQPAPSHLFLPPKGQRRGEGGGLM